MSIKQLHLSAGSRWRQAALADHGLVLQVNRESLDRPNSCSQSNERRAALSVDPQRPRRITAALSAVGVVLSLIFVGYELRQNTAAVKAAAIQELSAQSIEFLNAWATDDVIPGLLSRTSQGATPDDFTPEENQRLTLVYLAALRAYEARFIQVRLGVLDEDIFEEMAGSSLFYRRPWLKERWGELFESTLGPEFTAYFTNRFGIE